MKPDDYQFMALLRQPVARMTPEQLACLLNCQASAISVLIDARLLQPLGKPERNAPKFFATVKMLELANDPAWLDKMTTALQKYWRRRNQEKKQQSEKSRTEGAPAASDRPNGHRLTQLRAA